MSTAPLRRCLLALGLLLSPAAAAQEIVAEAALPKGELKVRFGFRMPDIVALGEGVVALPGGDVALVRPAESSAAAMVAGDFLVERRGADLEPTWATRLDLSEARWVSLAWTGQRLLVFTAEGDEIRARALDPETGAAGLPASLGRAGDDREGLRAVLRRFSRTLAIGEEVAFIESPGRRHFALVHTDEAGEHGLRVFDEALQQVSGLALDIEGPKRVQSQVTDDGTIILAGTRRRESTVSLQAVSPGGASAGLTMDLGQKVIHSIRADGGAEGVYLAALTGRRGDRVDALHLAGVDPATGSLTFQRALGTGELEAALARVGDEPPTIDEYTDLVLAEVAPDGALVVGLRSQLKVVTTRQSGVTGRSRSTTTFQGGDLLLVSCSPAGEVNWARRLPAAMFTASPTELPLRWVFSEDRLQLLYLHRPVALFKSTPRRLVIRDVALTDGALSEAVEPLGGLGDKRFYLSGSSAPLRVDEWLVASVTVNGLLDIGPPTLSRVRLGDLPEESAARPPAQPDAAPPAAPPATAPAEVKMVIAPPAAPAPRPTASAGAAPGPRSSTSGCWATRTSGAACSAACSSRRASPPRTSAAARAPRCGWITSWGSGASSPSTSTRGRPSWPRAWPGGAGCGCARTCGSRASAPSARRSWPRTTSARLWAWRSP